MGRTVMPNGHVLESEKEWWKPSRLALSKEDQARFGCLSERAKFHNRADITGLIFDKSFQEV